MDSMRLRSALLVWLGLACAGVVHAAETAADTPLAVVFGQRIHARDLVTPGGAKAPVGDLKGAIDAMGGLAGVSDKVNAAGMSRFGSGWAWLVVKDKKLDVISTANQDTPLELGAKPILGVDVWEHAYYLKYQNRRADYLKGWWNVVNWDKAGANFKKASG